jgi:hypothetical protein
MCALRDEPLNGELFYTDGITTSAHRNIICLGH